MAFIPLQWARQTVGGRQNETDGSRLKNLYAVSPVLPEEAKTPVLLYGAPGFNTWAKVPRKTFIRGSSTITPTKGIHALLVLKSSVRGYRLFGVSHEYFFFEINFDGTSGNPPDSYDPFRSSNPSSVHSVSSGDQHQLVTQDHEKISGQLRLATDGRRILFPIGRNAKMWDIDANSGAGGFVSLVAPTPQDQNAVLPDEEWVDAAWIDGYFFLATRSGQVFHSNLDSDQFDQLDFAKAEASPDDIIALSVQNRRLIVFGSNTIEQWFHSPRGTDFAFQRDNSYVAQIGAVSRDTVQTDEHATYFLGSDAIVYELRGMSLTAISNSVVAEDIQKSTLENARAFTYTEEQHRFYSLTLDQEGTLKNWTIDLTTGFWHERTTTNIKCAARLPGGRTIVGRDTNNIDDMRLDWGTDRGVAIAREAVSPIIEYRDQRVTCHEVRLEVPLYLGGQDDRIELSWSDDSGYNWKGDDGSSGKLGKKIDEGILIWRRLGTFRQRNFRIKTEGKQRIEMISAYMRTGLSLD